MPPSASDGVPRPRAFVVSAEVSSKSDVLDLYGADARCMRIYKSAGISASRPSARMINKTPRRKTHFVPPFLSRPRRRRDRPARAETMDALRLAAEAGDAGAMSDLGATYALGSEGLPQDDAEAFRWFTRSADAGLSLIHI